MGFLFKLPVSCVRIGSVCAITGSVVQARKRLLNKHCYLLWCGKFIPTGWHWCQTHVNGQSCEYWSTNLVCSGKCQLTSWEYFPQSVRHWLCLGWTCIWATVEVLKFSDFLKHFNSFSKISNYWGFIVWDLKYRYW